MHWYKHTDEVCLSMPRQCSVAKLYPHCQTQPSHRKTRTERESGSWRGGEWYKKVKVTKRKNMRHWKISQSFLVIVPCPHNVMHYVNVPTGQKSVCVCKKCCLDGVLTAAGKGEGVQIPVQQNTHTDSKAHSHTVQSLWPSTSEKVTLALRNLFAWADNLCNFYYNMHKTHRPHNVTTCAQTHTQCWFRKQWDVE